MKSIKHLPIEFSFYILIILVNFSPLNAQSLKVKAGFGATENKHIAISYRVSNFDIIGSAGSKFIETKLNDNLNLSLGFSIYFGEKSTRTKKSVWFIRNVNTFRKNNFIGITTTMTTSFPTPAYNSQSVITNLRIGREINITSRIGLEVDLGASLKIYDKFNDEVRAITFNSSILPSAELNVFYRLIR